MPKRHTHKNLNDYARHSNARNVQPSSSKPTLSVNERLQQLRKEEAAEASSDTKKAITDTATTKSVPPHLRALLHIPETAPPKPKPGTRVRASRRTPGPAPPRSWMLESIHAPKSPGSARSKTTRFTKDGAASRLRSPTVVNLPDLWTGAYQHHGRKSLLCQALRTMAENWDFVSEYEMYNLPTIPVKLKALLLSYMTLYAPDHGIRWRSLRMLFLTEEQIEGGTGSDELKHLDLSGLVGPNLTLSNIRDLFDINSESTISTTQIPPPVVADTWEEELEHLNIAPAIYTPRFPNLTHLSLSRPPPNTLWADLLLLSERLNTLTHLSLAYWPLPTLTPNSVTTTVIAPHGRPLAAGGTHFYSAMDEDWHEAASVLRLLAKNTYCLKYLDVTGCNEWVSALAWSERSQRYSPDDPGPQDGMPKAGWRASDSRGPDWNWEWRQVEEVKFGQGFVPDPMGANVRTPWVQERLGVKKIERVLAMLSEMESISNFTYNEGDEGRPPVDFSDLTEREFYDWYRGECRRRDVASKIAGMRRQAAGKYCRFDWGYPVPAGFWNNVGN